MAPRAKGPHDHRDGDKMSDDPARLPAGLSPRGLDIEQAAEYLGISRNHLLRFGPRATRIGGRCVYDRKVLDLWLDRLAGLESPSEQPNGLRNAINARKNALRNSA